MRRVTSGAGDVAHGSSFRPVQHRAFDKPMKLVDYEFASNNERAYELALLTAEMFYGEEQLLELWDFDSRWPCWLKAPEVQLVCRWSAA